MGIGYTVYFYVESIEEVRHGYFFSGWANLVPRTVSVCAQISIVAALHILLIASVKLERSVQGCMVRSAASTML